jgi:ATP-binding cassette, subfamily C (CFTR/MRP), member 1
LSATADGKNALQRLSQVFDADQVKFLEIPIDKELDSAIKVTNASFQWEKPIVNNVDEDNKEYTGENIFSLKDVNLSIERGTLCAIIGNVGGGKSSLLSGFIGNMRRTGGTIQIGGEIAYTPQIPWIQNATVVSSLFNYSHLESI